MIAYIGVEQSRWNLRDHRAVQWSWRLIRAGQHVRLLRADAGRALVGIEGSL